MKADVLVVDDQPDNVRLLSSILLEQGYKVRKALNGEMALKAVEVKLPDVILLDINMPSMTGYDVCEALKSNPKTRHIPVIFLSALNEPIDKVKAFQVGGADYVTKPFQLEEVLARLEHQITIQQQRQQLLEQNEQLKQEVLTRQQTEEILYQSRALLASVLNSSLDGVAAAQAVRDELGEIVDFRCLVINPVAARTLGRARDELAGKLMLRSLLQQIDPLMFKHFVQVVEKGEILQREFFHQSSDRTRSWFQVVAVKLGDGFSVTFRDISQQKLSEEALQLANQELQRLANLDGLTELANRRCFDETLEQEWRRLKREQSPLSLLLCDVDYFKAYNDLYGHQAGDACLRELAYALRTVVKRPADLVARYGGEEFALVLPNTSEEGAIHITEILQATVKHLNILHEASQVDSTVTVSVGIVSVVPSDKLSVNQLIATADKALYQAKANGRNQYVLQSHV
jgi:diguanylate cyclase (GGDEF)-like protein